MLELVLKFNILEFDSKLYRQQIGTSMGSTPAPSYSNISMARRLDQKIKNTLQKNTLGNTPLNLLKRFLDDIISIFYGSSKNIHKFLEEINKIHPAIKFTMQHTSIPGEDPNLRCSCPNKESIPFLDTLLTIKQGRVSIDLYRKPTDRNQYLLTSSCHPPQTTLNIPFSIALRIVRICTEEDQREQRFDELKQFLIDREYKPSMIDSAITKARSIPRKEALKNTAARNKQTRRPVLAVTWDPRLPPIPSIQLKHWRSMRSQDTMLAKAFKEPPLTAYSICR